MNLLHNAARAALLCAALYVCSGCASQQQLAIKDRDIRDLRQQVASRQEALVKTLKTLESVRADLDTARYERRELEQEIARSSASIRLQQQTIDRLEAQKAELQEKLRQSEIAYTRLEHTYQDIKAVLNNTVTELAQTRRDEVLTTEDSATLDRVEISRLLRKNDELRSQLIRERAMRRAPETERDPPALAPSGEEGSPWVWRLTEEPPEVETVEPGTVLAGEKDKASAADSSADEPNVLSTAFLWTLGAIPAIGIMLLMFVVLVRVMSRPGVDARNASSEETPAGEYGGEIHEVIDDADDYDAVGNEVPEHHEEEATATRVEEPPADDDTETGVEETESRPAVVTADSSSSEEEEKDVSPAETTFIQSLDWLEETAQPPLRRKKYSQDTEAVLLKDTSEVKESRETDSPESAPRDRDRSTASAEPAPEHRKVWRRQRETDDGYSDTQMIEKLEDEEIGVTQVLPSLEEESGDDGDPDRAFTETAVLDASDLGGARSESLEESHGLDEVATDTQVLPPLLDFEDDSELDEALTGTHAPGGARASREAEDETDGELLAELEDLMGEKFEEPAY